MRELNLERAEVVLLPASVLAEAKRDVKAPRAKVFVVVHDDEDAVQLLEAAALARWGPKIREHSDA